MNSSTIHVQFGILAAQLKYYQNINSKFLPYIRLSSLLLPFIFATASSLLGSTLPSSFDPATHSSLGGSANHVSTLTIIDANGTAYCAFVFDDVNIDSGVTISLTGSQGVAFLSQDDMSVSSDMSFLGADTANTVIDGATCDSGSDGGAIALVVEGYLEVFSALSVSGGLGGSYSATKEAGDGGDGGDAGTLLLAAPRMQLQGALDASGGADGDVGFYRLETQTGRSSGEM